MDERILAQRAQHSFTHQEQEGSEERNCFYCLLGVGVPRLPRPRR
jgi:hypothetical protein